MTSSVKTIWISAGDASGDVIAADLIYVIRERMPSARLIGMGGNEMAAAGLDRVVDADALAVGGLFELIPSLFRIFATWRRAVRALSACDPDLVILIDSGGFHLPFARAAKRRTHAPVLYYVAPQVWAWRGGRLPKLAARTDRIAVVLPFEPDFYAARDVTADFVGHPILDRVVAEPIGTEAQAEARRALDLDPEAPLLGLFPGSRRNELARNLPVQLEALNILQRERPNLVGVLVVAPSLDRSAVDSIVDAQGDGEGVLIRPADARLLDAIDVALAKPGTITLELMLRETPMVVMGIVQAASAAIAKRSLQVDCVALPNLIAEERIVPERLQSDATADRIAADLAALFPDGAGKNSASANQQIEALRAARHQLGESGASRRVAEIAVELLEGENVGTDRP